jgi:hypothetical protein
MSAGVEATDVSASPPRPVPATTTTGPAATWAFAGATFLGAFLLFFVQPMIARYILPWFGGGAAVWTTCLLFFQAVLLAGYAYAHLGVARLRPRAQSLVHVALLLAAVVLAAAGAVPSDRWKPPPGESFPVGRILALLAASVGLPCVVLSATSPLLHAWYARVQPDAGRSVYRLYALSNVGSLLALLGYPFLFEPWLGRSGQAALWTIGLAAYAALCAYCARLAARAGSPVVGIASTAAPPPDDLGAGGDRPTARRRFLWVALPACASVLLMATTNTMTQDVAPVPLLWVLPLALYLLTFILAFEFGRFYRRRVFGWALALAAVAVCAVLLLQHDFIFLEDNPLGIRSRIGLLAGAMFVGCMALHGELAALRPDPRHLTGFYLAIALGGAVGGLLVAVGAPLLLDRYAELHIGLWLCCALAFVAPYLAGASRGAPGTGGPGLGDLEKILAVAGLVVLAAALWTMATRPAEQGIPLHRSRDFYGALAVYRSRPTGNPADDLIWLNHGTIIHGLMYLAPSKQNHPTKYYTETSGAGRVFADPAWAGRPRRVGVVGLGAGTLAAFGRPGDVFRFYEISPAAVRFAADPFRFLRNSRATCEVVLGDGRVSLEREAPQNFDILVLDAFSGDAVPVHLLTKEAFDVYRRHLAAGGVIVVNCTNRYVALYPVLAKLAGHFGWASVYVFDRSNGGGYSAAPSEWVALSPDPARVEHVRRGSGSGARAMRTDFPFDMWTDERTNLFKVLR